MSLAEYPVKTPDAPKAAKSSFYTAMRILPREQRQAMYAIYAFCRAVDDVADEGGTRRDRLAELAAFTAEIDLLYAHGDVTFRTADLARPIAEFDLVKDDFHDVIDGMLMDVERDVQAPDWRELDLYCDRVASAVGRLSVRIFGIEPDLGIELSHHLGRALQLTNILRDLDEDAAMSRLYLPKETLAEFGVAGSDVDAILAHPALDSACHAVASKARDHFNKADLVMARCSRRSTKSPRLMASVYRAILEKLIVRGWHAPRMPVRHSKRQVIWAVVRDGLF